MQDRAQLCDGIRKVTTASGIDYGSNGMCHILVFCGPRQSGDRHQLRPVARRNKDERELGSHPEGDDGFAVAKQIGQVLQSEMERARREFEADIRLYDLFTVRHGLAGALQARGWACQIRAVGLDGFVECGSCRAQFIERSLIPRKCVATCAPEYAALGSNTDSGAQVATHFRGIIDRSRSEEHTSELQSHSDLLCRLLL